MQLFAFFRPCSNRLSAQEHEIRIAAASDLRFVIPELAPQFQKERQNISVSAIYDSSGNSFAKIQNGAPFDLFLSADIEYPQKLEAARLAEPGSLQEYAVGRIVIWMPPEGELKLKNLGWNSLLDAAVQKIAIANPEHAPYGRAAVVALQKAGVYDRLKAKLVYGENISQAAQFVQSGNAQAGIIARSFTLSPEMKEGQAWEIPAEMYPPIKQAGVVLRNAKNKQAAKDFLEFLKSESGRRILDKYGFSAPSRASSKTAAP